MKEKAVLRAIWVERGFSGVGTNSHAGLPSDAAPVSPQSSRPGFGGSVVEEGLHTCVICIGSNTTKWSASSNQSFKVRKSKYHLNESPETLLEVLKFL